MTAHGPQLSHLAPHLRGPPPHAETLALDVQVVDSPVSTSPAEPTAADILKALQELGQKVHQISKNQKALEHRLEGLKKRADAVHHNGVVGAQWLAAWNYCVFMNLDISGPPFVPEGVNEPHWR
jgi:hypothetical protein